MKTIRTAMGIRLLMALFILVPIRTEAALSLSDVPLFLTTAVDPNIIFTLDDSGSMQFEIMPDDLIPSTNSNSNTGDVRFVYPVREGTYGGSTYSNYVVGFDANNGYTAKLRSSHVNTIYYDPTVRYLPWSKADGSLMIDAKITCAPHNPWLIPNKNDPAKDCRNLTVNNSQSAGWLQSNNTLKTESRTFYPAVYFHYKGSGNINSASSYDQIEIKPENAPFNGGENRTDCANSSACTYDEEIQNFANWYTYYRSRVLLARAGVGRAFAAQGGNMRIGFGAINKGSSTIDGKSTATLITGVRQFSGTDRTNFFDQLYKHTIPQQGTPLRNAIKDVGEYLKRSDDQGPWSDTPGQTGGTQPVCRQNYHILMTDGYWDGTDSPGIGNSDGADGSVIINHFPNAAPATYQYKPVLPYSDNRSDTLADVAMHYWKNDLRSNLANKVPTNAKDPAFWQHMVNFTVGLGVQGSLTSLPGSPGGPTGWPNPTSSDSAKIDDLWHAAVNSRGEFFSAQDPATFAAGLTNALTNITARVSSAAAVTTNTSRLNTGAQIYQAKFNSADWSGQLLAFNLESDASLGELQWEASEQLPAHADRSIFTHNGTNGLAFTVANFSSLSTAQQAALDKNDGQGMARIGWLRGDKSGEISQGGSFRNRNNGVLGDIVNSDLLYIKSLDFSYDSLPAATPGQASYHSYRQSNNSRTPVVYTGANDGMLHAFNAETGVELFAYVPAAVYSGLNRLTASSYTHRYFVDGNAYVGDAYMGATPAWKTVLLGTLGGGGKSVFALDITDPVNFSEPDVLWEFTDADLGYVHGQAKIARLNDGSWAAIIGNGYNGNSDRAWLFIVDLQTGALIKKIPTNASTSNGLSTPALVDTNGDKIIDVVYAGDLRGNVWKFDLSQSDSTQWDVAYKSGSASVPLFTARNASNQAQPITSPLEVGYHKQGGYMIFFGTGQFVAESDKTDKKVQSLYGIWDKGSPIAETNRSVLQQQTITAETVIPPFERTVSDHSVDWSTKRGWYIDLLQSPEGTQQGERSVIMPMLNFGRIIFTTLIPSIDPCEAGGRNWLMLLDAETGGMMPKPQFDTNGDGKLNNNDRVIAAVGSDGIRSESVAISAGSLTHLIAATTTGAVEKVTISNGAPPPRRSWKQLQ
ncbi:MULTISPECIES: pilus assembly protein [Nitrosomonas]|uniref:Putative type 4 fimbrial biogenesis protein PilY1 n=1 Tax=Nitrosomonas europaea (strain ATCC 19718 / CIP 103999 / KCTC 2705 / NBRC 14298) TaxID=228410 RepID=Q82TX2_NITEU|nr:MULTISPECIES: PilC/PilY family type IV pilus protein [Nitrosomonas]CAD85658.1 putative type 4 fimbrial biogenesis protein PilY1 [Nitrosomonas europaea ATCC 19718]SDW79769.1 type IV pilus assembly protein PilY1 [Nitrosomonas europaea]SET34332.1 type IV pilus assembly protein PilY1 [Nitrosomonas europaea]SJZ90590.1 type IV pilus assembly protein PilY1 [Nitrosomonas europaea]HBF25851.1 pilus assembly protein PilY [Nitrosomonas sp.]